MPAPFLWTAACAAFIAAFPHVVEVHAADPADPRVPVPKTRYVPVTGGLKSYRPVEPKPWGSVNERVAPQPPSTKSEGGKK
jgi:hypothetical protein